ncbi:hypothetical protein FDUTEX481_01012 [Tolypothrix sp. PCC 7601]|nr:hypothetical protein FDUTEX481_01012 [Tolypothrix sp. PCC 7601]BAY91967.1 hypothetical protein NIES3275_39980 [Microchaete diplosiphon NIES-3275]
MIMGHKIPVEPQVRLENFLAHLEAARQLQREWMTYGLDCVNLYFDDVDEDWWEKWVEEEPQSFEAAVIAFLESDNWVAVRVRKQLQDKPICEIASKLDKYLSFPQEDQIFAIKNFLAGKVVVGDSYRYSTIEIDEIELFNLAAELLEKLEEIRGKNL